MVKSPEIVKSEGNPPLEKALRAALGRVPKSRFLKVIGDDKYCFASFLTGDREFPVLCQRVNRAEPKLLREAVEKLKADARSWDANTLPVVFANYLSEAARSICKDNDVGFVDEYGNCRLPLSGNYLEILIHERTDAVRGGGAKSVFSPASTRALRTLLQGPTRHWKIKELSETCGLSLGATSKVRQHLVDQEWAEADKDGLKITRPDALLDAWANTDSFGKRTTVQEFSTLTVDPAELAEKIHRYFDLAETKHAFTQWFAASLRRPYTTVPLVSVYVQKTPDVEELCKTLLARPVDSGGRLRLIYPKDPGVFTPIQTVHGLPLVADTQIYLDLLKAGLRGDDAAKELRAAPDFRGVSA